MGTLHLSFITSVPLVPVFTSAIRSFRVAFPDVHLELKSQASVKIIDDVLLGTMDVGFTRPSISTVMPTTLKVIPVYQDNLMAVLPVDHRLASGTEPIPISALREDKFVLRARGSGTGFYEQVFDICAEAGFSPQIVQEAVEATTTLGLVAAGVGITIAPEALRKINVHDIVWRELADANVASRIYLIYNSANTNPIRERFVSRFEPLALS
jgi:DNA-binding transcriptional LysR family regulator